MEYGEVSVGIRDTEDVVLAALALSPVQAQAIIVELTEALDTVDPDGTLRHRRDEA